MNRGSKQPSKVSESMHRQLNSYALAATAAGVTLLALAEPVNAKIVYTKTHEQILGQGQRLELDLNHDGINDFFFRVNSSALSTFSIAIFTKFSKNRIWGYAQGAELGASALPVNVQIGPSKHFSNGFLGRSRVSWGKFMVVEQCSTQNESCDTFGQWGGNEKNRYLGLEFRISGKRHYGWARVSFIDYYYTLTGYAYETIPNKPIKAGQTHGEDEIDPGSGASLTSPIPDIPQPATLGTLALGAPGLSIRRRRELLGAGQ